MGLSKKQVHLSLVVLAGVLLLAFQNCAPMKFESRENDKASIGPGLIAIDDPDREIPDNDHGSIPFEDGDGSEHTSDAHCESLLAGQNQITYASIADTNSAPVEFIGKDLRVPVSAENISFAGKGSYQNVSVTARNLEEIGALSADSISLNAVNIGHFGKFSVGELVAVANSIDEASSFSGTFCVNAHNIGKIKSLSSKASIYGRTENGVKAKLGSFSSASAFISLHDLEIGEIHNGSFSGRIENSTVEKLYSGAGVVYLVNSRIESIENFSGTIYLVGNSSIGSQKNSAIQIVK